MKRKLLGYEDIDDQIADRTYFPINYPLIRLEDVMLMYAEIVGPTGKGKEMVNKIRTRAGLDALDDDITIENFADSVDIERRRELASECVRVQLRYPGGWNHGRNPLARFGTSEPICRCIAGYVQAQWFRCQRSNHQAGNVRIIQTGHQRLIHLPDTGFTNESKRRIVRTE